MFWDEYYIRKNVFLISVVLLLGLIGSASAEILNGVYYYPWYGLTANSTYYSLRGHLVPDHDPALGNYDSRNSGVISAHIDYSHTANIHFWAVSWAGSNKYTDKVLKNNILPHPRAGELKYAILYESNNRIGPPDNPDYSKLIPDFDYIAKTYFGNPNYLKIKGKPVVFIYLARVYFAPGVGDAELAMLRAAHPELYIVADDVFGSGYSSAQAKKWDAVTVYDAYGQSLGTHGSTRQGLNQLKSNYDEAISACRRVNVPFIPTVGPGYNDRVVRSGHDGAPRYFEDKPNSVEGDVFRAMLRSVAVPRVDPRTGNMLMIVSFNEWHEDSQIEPTKGTAGKTKKDDSSSGDAYTQGDYYTDYGDLYLKILRQETTSQKPSSLKSSVQSQPR